MLIFMGENLPWKIPQPKPEDIPRSVSNEAAKISECVNQQGSIEQILPKRPD
jgi:hypothetical protein